MVVCWSCYPFQSSFAPRGVEGHPSRCDCRWFYWCLRNWAVAFAGNWWCKFCCPQAQSATLASVSKSVVQRAFSSFGCQSLQTDPWYWMCFYYHGDFRWSVLNSVDSLEASSSLNFTARESDLFLSCLNFWKLHFHETCLSMHSLFAWPWPMYLFFQRSNCHSPDWWDPEIQNLYQGNSVVNHQWWKDSKSSWLSVRSEDSCWQSFSSCLWSSFGPWDYWWNSQSLLHSGISRNPH